MAQAILLKDVENVGGRGDVDDFALLADVLDVGQEDGLGHG